MNKAKKQEFEKVRAEIIQLIQEIEQENTTYADLYHLKVYIKNSGFEER